jgi:FKBP-type peptidyl-prolyl cis-trans isomerase
MSQNEFEDFQRIQYEKMQQEMEQQSNDQLSIDLELIDNYLKENNITAKSAESGLRYVITKMGSGENAAPGDNVTVHYTGMLLNGEKFDSSLDRNQPFSFQLGQGMVIRGWDEGITYFNKGSEGTLYIPSTLGYGTSGAGGVIPPNAVLIFEIQVLDY